jgi:hypothetical protein
LAPPLNSRVREAIACVRITIVSLPRSIGCDQSATTYKKSIR